MTDDEAEPPSGSPQPPEINPPAANPRLTPVFIEGQGFLSAQPQPRWPIATWGPLDAIVAFLIAYGATHVIVILIDDMLPLTLTLRLLSLPIAEEIAVVGAVLLWLKHVVKSPFSSLAIRRPSLRDVGAGILTGVLLYFASHWVSHLAYSIAKSYLGHPPYPHSSFFDVPFSRTEFLLVVPAVVVVLAPFAEEILFRGVLFQGMRNRFSLFPSMIFSAIPFAFIHISLLRLPDVFVGGLLLAFVFDRRRNLVASMVAHGTLNAIVLGIYFHARY